MYLCKNSNLSRIENLNSILQQYITETESKMKLSDKSCFVKGLAGSSLAFIASAIHGKSETPLVIVLNEKEEAAYAFSDLSALLGMEKVFFFPSSYKRSIQFDQVLPEAIIQRTDVLNLLRQMDDGQNVKSVIVTYSDALFEKIPLREVLKENTLTIVKGERVSTDFITEVLFEYGFERTDFVYEPGQFAIRGSIIDVFSYSSAMPYRIDFFGDEVESIRTFDVEDQLSRDLLQSISIIPNLQEKKQTEGEILTNELPEDSIVWVKNPELVLERLNQLADIAQQIDFKTQAGYATGKEFFSSLQNHSTFYFGLRPPVSVQQTIEFTTSPQPSFSKNFELLADDIEQKNLNGYRVYLLSENQAQLERLNNILHSVKPDLQFDVVNESISEGFVDHSLRICLYTDRQIFDRYHKYRLKHEFSRRDALTMQELINLQPGDYVVHIDHGIGVFGGLVKTEVNGRVQEAIRLIYQDNDTLLVNIHNLHKISKYRGKDAEPPKVYKLGSGAWQKLKQRTKAKIKDIAKDLIALYAKRKAQKGFAFSPDTYMQQELEASFIYEDTPDQQKATQAVKLDMEDERPMDRLVCGDVGFGKTEVAIRAAFKAVADSKQVAVLVPTTILALQHYRTFTSRLNGFPCTVEFISRMKTAAQQREIRQRLKEGKIDILIGTHSILKEASNFKDLGLLIVDEEQKFGVAAKEKIRQFRLNVDTLTLTATPIPRTLQFSLMGARDLSIINTPPPNRYPIQTELHIFNAAIIKEAIEYEVSRGGQVFFVHNRVQNIQEVQIMLQKIVPKIRTAVAHGQMEPSKLESIMLDFINGDYDVLISTAIIEAGLDIPNANTIIINNAHMFGLSDLHQLRGRVGRSNKKAFCYLLAPPLEALTPEARRRLKAIEEFSELGSGFSIAMQDLDIRGAGNLLGAEQSGFITEIGYETYQRILDEAIEELKETEFRELFTSQQSEIRTDKWVGSNVDCQVETDLEVLIPDYYVSNTAERIKLYRELDSIKSSQELESFGNELRDRFGPIPEPVAELMNIVRLRWVAVELGIEKIMLKNGKAHAYFISNQLSPFYRTSTFERIINYILRNPSIFAMKEGNDKLILTIKDTPDVSKAIAILQQMYDSIR